MRVRIAAPALQPNLLVYLPMETIQVDGETRLREYVSGKHAKFQKLGTWQVEESEAPFTGTVPAPTLTITEDETTHYAGVPFRLIANTSLNATKWEWTVNGSTSNVQLSTLNSQLSTFNYSKRLWQAGRTEE